MNGIPDGQTPAYGNGMLGMDDVYVAEEVSANPTPAKPLSLKSLSIDDKMLVAGFPAGDLQRVTAVVDEFFVAQGYRLEYGVPTSGCYGIGSDVMRVLLGAFAKRYKFDVSIGPHVNGDLVLQITKGMSGAMGGVLGYNAMKKETARIFAALQASFS